MKHVSLSALAFATLMGLSTAAFAGPIWVFSGSTGSQAADAGIITLTQNGANSVDVSVDLKNGYGFINSGGPPTAFPLKSAGVGQLELKFNNPPPGPYTPTPRSPSIWPGRTR